VKQVVVDAGCGRIDTAKRNILECERIDSSYIGTTIARLCVNVFMLTSPSGSDVSPKALMAQVKRDYETLKGYSEIVSTEEQALYESFEENADVALAALLITFDSLGDKVHAPFLLEMLDVRGVYAPALNSSLLRYALRNSRMDMAAQIFENADNLDPNTALALLLGGYPDDDQKVGLAQKLAGVIQPTQQVRNTLENYLNDGKDSTATKQKIYTLFADAGVYCAVTVVIRNLLSGSDVSEEAAVGIIRSICKGKPNDVEINALVQTIILEHSAECALQELEVLSKSGLYILVAPALVMKFLARTELSAECRLRLLDAVKGFGVNAKAMDTIIFTYLKNVADEASERIKMVRGLIENAETLSTAGFSDYVVNCTLDGENKPEIMSELLGIELNKSFFHGLLKEYMAKSGDSPAVKEKIIAMLVDFGLQVDSDAIIDVACTATRDNYEKQAADIQKMLDNGTRLSFGALSDYLERVEAAKISPHIIQLLYRPGCKISDNAINKYVLGYPADSSKLHMIAIFSSEIGPGFGNSRCRINHLGYTIDCSLMQAYILCCSDGETIANGVCECFRDERNALAADFAVNGQYVKFKKYVQQCKESLGELTLLLCNRYRLFSLF